VGDHATAPPNDGPRINSIRPISTGLVIGMPKTIYSPPLILVLGMANQNPVFFAMRVAAMGLPLDAKCSPAADCLLLPYMGMRVYP